MSRRKRKYSERIIGDEQRSLAIAGFLHEKVRLDNIWPVIVFVREKRHAHLLADAIGRRFNTLIEVITSDRRQSDCDDVARRMRERDPAVQLVVATSKWSTGLDIPSLRAVMLAGAGSAPAGLKQSAGRGARLDGKVDEYEVWDWVDIGEGCENYVEQAQRRLEHYEEGGLALSEAARASRTPPEVQLETDPDVARLEKMLDDGSGESPTQEDERQRSIARDATAKQHGRETTDSYSCTREKPSGYWWGMVGRTEAWVIAAVLLIMLVIGECSKNNGI